MAKGASGAEPAEEAPVHYGESGSGGCDYAECGSTEGYRCLYRDRRAVSCDWVACQDHLKVVEGRAYCLRHASIMEVLQLARQQGTEMLPPDLNDRCASLARAVASDLNEPVVDRLVRWGDASTTILNDPSIRYSRVDRIHHSPGHWERVWGLAAKTGILLRVAVRVEDTRPETVILTTGVTHLVAAVPPWIQRHLRGDPSDGSQSELVERLAFQQQLLLALDEHVEKYGITFSRSLLPEGTGSGGPSGFIIG